MAISPEKRAALAQIILKRRNSQVRNILFDKQREVYDHVRKELDQAGAELNRILDLCGGNPLLVDPDQIADLAPKPIFAKTPRRGAKTTLAAGIQLDDAPRHPNAHYPFIAISGPAARGQAWPVFKWWRDQLGLDLHMNEGDMSWRLPNGANGKLWGADREDLHRSFLGGKNRIVVVDESAYWKTDLGGFHRDKISPTVADQMGIVIYLSAPSERLQGFFYDHTRDDDKTLRLPGAQVYSWATDDNPNMAIQLAMLRKQWEAADPNYKERPWYRRQWEGEWVAETEDGVWRYDRNLNTLELPWKAPYGERYVLGMDSGYTDGMAYVLLSYNPYEHGNIIVHKAEWYTEELTDKIAKRIKLYIGKYNPEIVVDPNNAQLIADLDRIYSVPTDPAKKTDKLHWIRTVNSLLQDGTIQVKEPDGDCTALVVDLEGMKKKYDKDTKVTVMDDGTRVIQGPGTWDIDLTSAPGHAGHAFLYGVRHCHSQMFKPSKPRPEEMSEEWIKQTTDAFRKNSRKKARQGRQWKR